jgi:putative tryptophan/tyrosine transport system substrate-binding protein
MATETDPVVAGRVSSLGRPGGNVTGVTLRNPELAGKRLELLKEAVPGLVRVGVLWNPGDPESVEHWQAAQPPARQLGLPRAPSRFTTFRVPRPMPRGDPRRLIR